MIYALIAAVLVAVDQLVKYLVMTRIPLGEHVPFIPYILDLTYVTNTGAAFSIFSEHTWALALVSLVMSLALALALLSACDKAEVEEKAKEALNGALEKAGEKIISALDQLENAEYQGGPFENNEESARAYLLGQLEEKYGEKFIVVGRENLKNYGALAGATYSCQAAPAEEPVPDQKKPVPPAESSRDSGRPPIQEQQPLESPFVKFR